MTRFFSLLLMLLLPLQFSFAAAAAYCVDEKPEVSAHFGHHDHTDASTDSADDANDGKADCEVCHLACAKVQPTAFVSTVAPEPQAPLFFLPDPSPQHEPEPSDRPPIVSAA